MASRAYKATTWFFERMILEQNLRGYQVFDEPPVQFPVQLVSRERRRAPAPWQARPDYTAVGSTRSPPIVPSSMQRWRGCSTRARPASAELIELGSDHEQQHQELLLTDTFSLFAAEPLQPAYREAGRASAPAMRAARWIGVRGRHGRGRARRRGLRLGQRRPAARALIQAYKLAERLRHQRRMDRLHRQRGLSHAAALARGRMEHGERGRLGRGRFISRRPRTVPGQMSLMGFRPVDPAAPVTNVSYFEADAFARWAGYRLPREFEWEIAAASDPLDGRKFGAGHLRPMPCPGRTRPPADVRRCMGMDGERLSAVSGLQGRARRGRRVQRQVHVQSVRAPRRLVRDARGPYAADLSQFILSPSAMAVHGPEVGAAERVMESEVSLYLPTRLDRNVAEPPRRGGRQVTSSPKPCCPVFARRNAQRSLPLLLRRARLGAVRGDHRARRDYPTRTETALLEANGEEIAALAGHGRVLVEFGSGSSRKTSLLLGALGAGTGLYPDRHRRGEPREKPAAWLSRRHPGSHYPAAHRRLHHDPRTPRALARAEARLGFFSGSTIGNLTPTEARALLGKLRVCSGTGGG